MREPTLISGSHISSINSICTSRSNLLLYSDIHPYSLYEYCHHQAVLRQIDLKDFYPAHFEKNVRHCQHPSTEFIKRTIEVFDWKRVLEYSNEISKCFFRKKPA